MAPQSRASDVTEASGFVVSEEAATGVGLTGSFPDFNERPGDPYVPVSLFVPLSYQDGNGHAGRKETETLSQKATCASVISSLPSNGEGREWHHVSSEYPEEGRDPEGSTSVPPPSIAFGLSRWAVFGLYCVYCVLSGPAYINWTPLADVLFKAGAFEWLCGGVSTSPDFPLIGDGMAKCEDQEAEVNRLFTVTAASHFFFSFIGGSLLDFIGPKATAIVGLLFGITGWILLGVANEHLPTYIPGCLFMGAGLDTTYFPLLSGANLFPGHVATVKAVLGAALSFSFLVPIAIRSVYFRSGGAIHHRLLFFSFAGACLGFSLLIALFIVPRRPWRAPYKPFGQRLRDQPLGGACGLAIQSGIRLASTPPWESLDDREAQEDRVERAKDQADKEISYVAVPLPPSSCEEKRPLPVLPLASLPPAAGGIRQSSCGNEAGNATTKPHGNLRNCALFQRPWQPTGRQPQTPGRPYAFTQKMRHHLRTLHRDVCSSLFLPIVPFFCVVLTGVVFFIPSARHLMPDAYAANRIIQIFSFVPCPLFGHIADVWGILPVMYICNFCGLLSFSFVMIPTIPAAAELQYAASLLAAFQLSFLVCQICCYVAETFDEENQGKLIGLLCSIAGITSLTAHPIMDYSVRSGFRTALLSFIGGFGFNVVLLLFVHWRKEKTGRLPTKNEHVRVFIRASPAPTVGRVEQPQKWER
uniref:Putative transporter, major facilitator family domain containing protein n=1 Tax=Neospora caninum (strain Liverpool) TaxID=572307 RepID=A0A0F7UQ84_NEOCL|nr:TPA: putative transporter, major facilitator family domain containing protein [Neospora caninum Liverpool]